MELQFQVKNQRLYLNTVNQVVADSKNYLTATFTFTDDWDGATKIAQFTRGTTTTNVTISNGSCTVPQSVLAGEGEFFVSVYGSINNMATIITANAIKIAVLPSGFVANAGSISQADAAALQAHADAVTAVVNNSTASLGGYAKEVVFTVRGQSMYLTSRGKVVADSQGYLGAKFLFSEDWADTIKVAQFKRDDLFFSIILNSDGTCTIPWEVLVDEGTFIVSVFGNNRPNQQNKIITVNPVEVHVEKSGLTEGELPSNPTYGIDGSTLYEIMVYTDRAEAAASTATTAKNQAQGYASDANESADSASASASAASQSATSASNSATAAANSATAAANAQMVVENYASGFAPLTSPDFDGIPTAPTATRGTNTTQIATTEYVQAELEDYVTLAALADVDFDDYVEKMSADYIKSASVSGDTLTLTKGNDATVTYTPDIPTNISDLTNDAGYITGVDWDDVGDKPTDFPPSSHNHDGTYLKLSGGTLTGTTYATTQSANDNSTKLATTAYADTAAANAAASLASTASEVLDTLADLSAALGDDPNFASTMATQLASKANASDLNNYLPLAGGTMTGSILFTGINDRSAGIDLNNDGKNFDIGWNWTNRDGAGFYLRSTDFTTTTGGGFGAYARNATNSYDLFGNPNGSLTWNGTSFTVGGGTGTITGNITANVLTGYSKPSSTSALAATDTLNGALGKLEKALDGKQKSGIFPELGDTGRSFLAGTEDINDIVTPGTYWWSNDSGNTAPTNAPCYYGKMFVFTALSSRWVHQIVYPYNSNQYYARRRDTNSTTWTDWIRPAFLDSNITGNAATATTATTAKGVLLDVTGTSPAQGTSIALPLQYKNKSTDSSNTVKTTAPFFCFPSSSTAANGEGFGIQSNGCIAIGAGESAKNLISTSTINGSTESVYITADNSVCICSNCDTIANRKSWTFDASNQILSYDRAITRGTAPSSGYSRWLLAMVAYGNEDAKYMAGIYKTINTANITGTYLYDYPNTATTSTNTGVGGHAIGICHDASGNAYTSAPTPAASSNGTNIATTEWVRTYATLSNIGAAASSHNHAASAITSGTLGVARGGTGETSAVDAANAFLNALTTGSSAPVDADYYISQYAGGGTNTTTYHRRPMSALWSYIKGKADSVYSTTDEKLKTSPATPTSATSYYPILSSSSSETTSTLYKNQYIRAYIRSGTESTEGLSRIYLGNTAATGTANNSTGGILMYGTKGKYAFITPHTGDTSDRTLYTPKAAGTLVCHTTDTAIGSASVPVYVTANGVATACTSLDATKLSGTIPSECYTNTTYSAGTAALLTAGTNTSNRVWQAKIIADYVKGTLSAAQNGYVVLPNGLIINWGKYVHSSTGNARNVTVTFPKAYATACYSVTLALGGDIYTSQGSLSWHQVTDITKTNFIIGTVNQNMPHYWIAIGV